ncbi:hypothetical protein N0V83_002934 [Neocucurbitaria cava]|uniref:Uncharacterized protein n=1 Tax=Neocucurbitaria cava TaxID=798079 RepID=A0A9W9CPZ7_9PLEO|nr:hypothetical protein N0V83_002934 [Neocucurbitaria cava]
MPRFPSKDPEDAADFSWDTFPPAPPEAADWQPDPESIARPGNLPDPRFSQLPDPRFHRNPCERVRREAYTRKAPTSSRPAHVAASLDSASASPAVGGANLARSERNPGLASVFRASGRARELESDFSPSPSTCSFGSSADFMTSPYDASSKLVTSSTAPPATAAKGTMENFPFTAYNSPSSLASNDSRKIVSRSKSARPAWAAPLDKLLAEEIRAAPTIPTKLPTQPVKAASGSVPPHLRKSRWATDGTKGSSLDPAAKTYKPSMSQHGKTPLSPIKETLNTESHDQEEGKRDDWALAWEMATTDLDLDDAKGLELQATLLSEYNSEPPGPTPPLAPLPVKSHPFMNHDHWMKTRMVLIMEEELDLSKRATKRELMAMTDDEIDRYYTKVSSAHKHWWEAEQRYIMDDADKSE